MKNTTNCLLMVLLPGGLALAGCGKPASTQVQGTIAAMDIPKFQQAFPSPTPAQQSSIDKVRMGVRYGTYPDALAAFDKLASDPSLTEPQKKAVSDLIEGVKQTLAKAATTPAK